MIVVQKRYQQNPQGGFLSFQVNVQMCYCIMNSVCKGSYFFKTHNLLFLQDTQLGIWEGRLEGVSGTLGLNLSGIGEVVEEEKEEKEEEADVT